MLEGWVCRVESDTRQTCGSAILCGAGPTRTHFTMFETLHACVPVHATAKHVLEMEHKRLVRTLNGGSERDTYLSVLIYSPWESSSAH
jgi:hypothetical protein